MFKKIITILMLCTLCLCTFAACAAEDDTPEGYQLIANEGDCFRLYVPTQGWMPNTTGGGTGAIFSMTENAAVNVYKVDDAEGLPLDEYWEKCNVRFKEKLTEYEYLGKEGNLVFGGQPGQKHLFKAKIKTVDSGIESEKFYRFLLVMAQYKGETYLFVYHAPEEHYESHLAEIEGDTDGKGVIPFFKFAEPYVSGEEKEYSDKVTVPHGMKLISTDERPYRFFVPTDWTVNDRAEFPAANLPDGSNVSAHMYMTSDESKTVKDYFADCAKRYQEIFEVYTLGESKEITMDGVSAMQYTYTVVSGGKEYKQLQAIVMKGAVYYTVTYTAFPESFDAHLADVQKMIESFDIR